MVAEVDINETTMNVAAEEWLEAQFEKFDFEGFKDDDKSEIRAVFMNTMRPATYELFDDDVRACELINRQGKKLRAIVNMIRGEPPEDTLWSTHDADLLVSDALEKNKIAEKALTTLLGFVENVTLKAVINEALAELRPRCCPNCSSVEITSSMKVEKFPYHLHNAGTVEEMELEAEVRAFTCYICEQQWTDHTAEAAREVVVNAMLVSKGLKRIGE
jgi:hypothetical protein